jgi:hypothetical protein
MKIEQSKSVLVSNTKKTKKSAGASSPFTIEDGASSVGSAAPVFSLNASDALEALQGVNYDDSSQDQERGHKVLNLLDGLRHNVLFGQISLSQLREVETLVGQHRGKNLDPQLLEILDEIDLRAKVEIAKYEQ